MEISNFKYVQMHQDNQGAYCGSFKECGRDDCSYCPVGFDFSVGQWYFTDTDILYSSFYWYDGLDYDVCVLDVHHGDQSLCKS